MSTIYSIAVIEDSPSDMTLLRMGLTKTGLLFELREIPDGPEALQFLSRTTTIPDLIITDLIVPGLDLNTLIAALKETETLKSVPVIVLSGMTDARLAARAGEHENVADYIIKPGDLQGWWRVGERVKNVLEKKKSKHAGGADADR